MFGLVALALVSSLSAFLPDPSRRVFAVALFAVWAALIIRFFVIGAQYTYWACPRCGKAFHRAGGCFSDASIPLLADAFAADCLMGGV